MSVYYILISIFLVLIYMVTWYKTVKLNGNKKLWIIPVLFTIGALAVILYINRNRWQIHYLNKVYPNGGIDYGMYNSLEFIFTDNLPKDVINNYKKTSYKAEIPGPSCQQKPCKCIIGADGTKIPDVQFDQDPVWDGQWPPCSFGNVFSQFGTSGLYSWAGTDDVKEVAPPCCSSVDNAKKCISVINKMDGEDPKCTTNPCMQLNGMRWGAGDMWGGMRTASQYNPPEYNQLWKPTLHPDFTGVISKYRKDSWWTFYNKDGDDSNSWVEVIHTFFPNEEKGGAGGAWFYRAKGSGIYLNMGDTFSGYNKFHVFVKLLGSKIVNKQVVIDEEEGLDKFTDFMLKDSKIDTTAFWAGNLVKNMISRPIWDNYIFSSVGSTTKDRLKSLLRATYDPLSLISKPEKKDMIFLYTINRLANTGDLDLDIVAACKDYINLFASIGKTKKIRTIQFTIQPNLYPGWTTEILYIGDTFPSKPIYNIKDVPKTQLRTFSPSNVPSDGSIGKSDACNFKYPLRFLYCDNLTKTWLNPKIHSADDTIKDYTGCNNY